MALLLCDFVSEKDNNLIKHHTSQEVIKLIHLPHFQENLDTLELLLKLLNLITVQLRRHYTPEHCEAPFFSVAFFSNTMSRAWQNHAQLSTRNKKSEPKSSYGSEPCSKYCTSETWGEGKTHRQYTGWSWQQLSRNLPILRQGALTRVGFAAGSHTIRLHQPQAIALIPSTATDLVWPNRMHQPGTSSCPGGRATLSGSEYNMLDATMLTFLIQPYGNSPRFNEVVLLFRNHISALFRRDQLQFSSSVLWVLSGTDIGLTVLAWGMVTVPHIHRGEDFPSLPAAEMEQVFPCKDLMWAVEKSMVMCKSWLITRQLPSCFSIKWERKKTPCIWNRGAGRNRVVQIQGKEAGGQVV